MIESKSLERKNAIWVNKGEQEALPNLSLIEINKPKKVVFCVCVWGCGMLSLLSTILKLPNDNLERGTRSRWPD